MKVPLTRPWTDAREHELVGAVIDSGWLTQGPRVTEFEHAIARRVGAGHAVAFTSCTTALHVALLLHGIGPGDEVVVPSYTWIATANVVRMVGATPVFADIDLATFNVTAATIEPRLSSRTRALMPVHQFGMPADMHPIMTLGRERGLTVIEDAACAIGSAYRSQPIGGLGNTTCFSFHPRKVLTTGEGGMLVTDDAELAARARVLINHGASVSDLHKHQAGTVEALLAEEFGEVGYNYRLTNLQAALGLAQLERLDDGLALRIARARRYNDCFAGHRWITPPTEPSYAQSNWQSYAVRISQESPVPRNRVTQRLLDAGVACRPAYMACHLQPVYRDSISINLPNTEAALAEVLILPLYSQMTDEEQDYVVATLNGAFA
ncbi:MAG TPA: DegT/DnrJ/EryC1/StrS family aminotransferase [Polyangiaceae bacterium]|nr:DegT/DnrJ/EryC1/StrS family aminotransferase [Polyangiaceae bacterium]